MHISKAAISPTMKKLTLATLLIFSCATAWAADFDKGLAAARAGDFATALAEWKPLAEQGDAVAQFYLGVMYANGEGVLEDDKEAVKWFKLAAEQGYAKAQYNLGLMYDNGEGVIQDNVYAHMWCNIAASNGSENAKKGKDILAKQMTPQDISKAQDLARECVKKNYKDC
jgi:TPR repeat protein